MSDVEKAEQTLVELERKRKALVESRAADDVERRAVAFKAHADGDKAALACRALCRARVSKELERCRETQIAEHLKLVRYFIDRPGQVEP
jgi:hypothetical protein